MKIRHQELEILEDNPFFNCKLAREPYADVLTDIVSTYADGFVLAINNEWGTGKTTFVKMWQQKLVNDGFQTIYFNAWENDFDSNPLVALMSELKAITNSKNESLFKSVIEKGAILIKDTAPAILKALASKYIDSEAIVDAINNTATASTEILEEEIKEYISKKKTIVDFKKDLEGFIKQANTTKPLIFIVDELDRCRPTYSVEVLEQIKHFFSVKGIVFVLSIDKRHLGASVKGVYGSEAIDSEEYLRRFIDLEYSIPAIDMKKSIDYYFNFFQLSKLNFDHEDFLRMAEFLFLIKRPTLRQQEKLFSIIKLALLTFKENQIIFPQLLIFLVYQKVMNGDFYKRLINAELTLQELSNFIEGELVIELYENRNIDVAYIEALFLILYSNYKPNGRVRDLYVKEKGNEPYITIVSKLNSEDSILTKRIDEICNSRLNHISLAFLINRINLTHSFIIN